MSEFDIILIVLACVAAFFALCVTLYLAVLVRPRAKRPSKESLLCDYAHRGLHGGSVPENSMAAFERACDEGVGIELDIQLSRDGEVMVFHDYTLIRMTGVDKKLCELTAAELCELTISQINSIPQAEGMEGYCYHMSFDISKESNLSAFLIYLAMEHPEYTPIGIYKHITFLKK